MLPPERRALLLLLTLAVAGQGVRLLATRPGEPPGQVQLLPSLSDGSPTAQRDSTMQEARPLAPGELVDADRRSRRPSSLACRGLAWHWQRSLWQIGMPRGRSAAWKGSIGCPGSAPDCSGPWPRTSPSAGSRRAAPNTPGAGLGTAFAPPPPGSVAVAASGQPDTVLNVNRATAVELEGLPGIGPSLARRIVADREARGPFATVEALDRIPGIGPGLVARLGRLVTAP